MLTHKVINNYASVTKAADGKLSAVASTSTIDRDGEVILPSAFKLDDYRRNPVILAAHQHRSMSGAPTIIGSADRIEVKDDALAFDMTFADTPLASEWRSLYEAKHARAFSVGFSPIEGEWRQMGGREVYVYTAAELFEISAVAVPANPDALAQERMMKDVEQLVDSRIEAKFGALILDRLSNLA